MLIEFDGIDPVQRRIIACCKVSSRHGRVLIAEPDFRHGALKERAHFVDVEARLCGLRHGREMGCCFLSGCLGDRRHIDSRLARTIVVP